LKDVLKDIRAYHWMLFWLGSWIIIAMVGQQALLAYIPLTALILKGRGKDLEVLLGFLFLLVLSDSRQPMFEFAQTTKNIYAVLLAMFAMMDMGSVSRQTRIYPRFLPFILFAFFCLAFSPVAATGAQKTLSYILVIFAVPLMLNKLMETDKERTIRGLIFLLGVVLTAGLALRFVSPLFVTLEGRFTGLFGNPNGLGIYASISFAFFSILISKYPKVVGKIYRYGIFAALLLSIYLCGSRNALFAILLFILFRNLNKLSPFLGFVIFMALAASFTYIQSNLVEIILALGLEDYFRIETLEGGSGRTIAWDFAIEQIDKEPYIGKGFGFTEHIFRQNYTMLSLMGHQGNAHNSYLTIWLDTGLIGLVLYAVGFIGSFVKASRVHKLALPALYLILFSGMFESWLAASLNPVTSIVWMMLAVMLFVDDEDEEEEEDEEDTADVEDDPNDNTDTDEKPALPVPVY
jgi:O-antigen ligase